MKAAAAAAVVISAGLLAGIALAAGPPAVTTGTVAVRALSPETATFEATFSGTLSDASEPTSYYFEYERNEEGREIPEKTPEQQAPASAEEQQVTATSGALAEGIYKFRLVAANADGTAYGYWVLFSETKAAPKEDPPGPGQTSTSSNTELGRTDDSPQSTAQSHSQSHSQCVVPRLTDSTLATSRRKLSAAGCKVGRIRYARSTRARKGRVIAQGVRAGTKTVSGTKVSVTISRGR